MATQDQVNVFPKPHQVKLVEGAGCKRCVFYTSGNCGDSLSPEGRASDNAEAYHWAKCTDGDGECGWVLKEA